MLFFTSDLHLGHENVLRFCNRPWETTQAMNAAIINNINATVGYHDELYILGDFSYRIGVAEARELLDRIQCQNISLIRGNHDKNWAQVEGGSRFREVCDYRELTLDDGHKLCLMHYPLLEWNGSRRSYSIHLHGHQHHQGQEYNLDNFSRGVFRYDVGIDANDYKPVSAAEIIELTGLYEGDAQDERDELTE